MYDYHPGAETLMSKHFSLSDQTNGYGDPFNSDPNVARPYSHTKNALLRQHASESLTRIGNMQHARLIVYEGPCDQKYF